MSQEAARAAFEKLVQPHFDRLWRLAFRLTGRRAEAEDLFQELLIKAFGRLDDLVTIDEPGFWPAAVSKAWRDPTTLPGTASAWKSSSCWKMPSRS
jgi:DNA-directed RNA polymerase specialized sigma24 family protein